MTQPVQTIHMPGLDETSSTICLGLAGDGSQAPWLIW